MMRKGPSLTAATYSRPSKRKWRRVQSNAPPSLVGNQSELERQAGQIGLTILVADVDLVRIVVHVGKLLRVGQIVALHVDRQSVVCPRTEIVADLGVQIRLRLGQIGRDLRVEQLIVAEIGRTMRQR